jgi:hypothetical protein
MVNLVAFVKEYLDKDSAFFQRLMTHQVIFYISCASTMVVASGK